MLLCGAISLVLMYTDIRIGSTTFAFHSLILTSALTTIGVQSIFFWIILDLVAVQRGLLPPDPVFDGLRLGLTLERCLVLGGVLILVGFAAALYSLLHWYTASFGSDP